MGHDRFIGSGWAFPVATDATGGIALVSNDTEIRQSIRLVLATTPVLEGTLLIDVRYRHRDEDDPRNLVFPFYTIPAREPAAVEGGG